MQVARPIDRFMQGRSGSLALSFNEKDWIILSEIGLGQIPTATSFVDFVSEKHGFSASGIWYTLKKLKKIGLLDFTEKGEMYRPLSLTGEGLGVLRGRGVQAEVVRQYAYNSMRIRASI